MNESIIPLSRVRNVQVDRRACLPESAFVLALPSKRIADEMTMSFLKDAGLDADARGLWIGYPNLKHSVDSLINWVGADWPSLQVPTEPALPRAIALAISTVKAGLARQEIQRRFVIANFHNGLSSIAKDLSGYCAWGCTSQKTVEQWEPFVQPFHTWCEAGSFDKVLFSRVEKANEIDPDGLIWKMRSSIAPLNDVGVIHRYGPRQ